MAGGGCEPPIPAMGRWRRDGCQPATSKCLGAPSSSPDGGVDGTKSDLAGTARGSEMNGLL